MADLIVLGFPNKETAEQVAAVGAQLRKEELLDLEDAAIVWRTADGKIKTQQSFNPTGAGAASGALWGTLFGMLFLMPIFGMAVGAASGAIAGKLTDIGIDDAFMKDVAATLEPGSAAILGPCRPVLGCAPSGFSCAAGSVPTGRPSRRSTPTQK